MIGAIGLFWRLAISKTLAEQSLRSKAQAERDLGNFAEAERLLKEAIDSNAGSVSSQATLRWELACLYQELERWPEATEQMEAALEVSLQADAPYGRQIRAAAPQMLVQLYAKQNRWAESEVFLRKELQAATGQVRAHWLQELAAALVNLRQTDEAIEVLDEAAQIRATLADDPQSLYPRALRMLGMIANVGGHPERARTAFERMRALADERWHPDAWLGLAQAEQRAGNFEQSLRWYEMLPDPDSDLLVKMAEVLFELGRVEEARARVRQAGVEDERAQQLLRRIAGTEVV